MLQTVWAAIQIAAQSVEGQFRRRPILGPNSFWCFLSCKAGCVNTGHFLLICSTLRIALLAKDGGKVTSVVATPGQGPDRPEEVTYTDVRVIGNGSFGVVYQAKLCQSGEIVAIKKVLQDKRFKVGGWFTYLQFYISECLSLRFRCKVNKLGFVRCK